MKKTWLTIVIIIAVLLVGGAIWYVSVSHSAGQDNGYVQSESTSTAAMNSASTTASGASTTGSSAEATTTASGTSGKPVAGPGQHCGGNMMNAPVCGTGYQCEPEPGSHLPFGDVGGVCVAVNASASSSINAQ